MRAARKAEEGFVLVGLIVAIFIILLVLGVAAPRVAKELRREREVEAIHRGNQYVRAVQLYYHKNGSYPGSVDQMEKSNNIRFLRQKYVDPMTGKADWKLIHVGEAKTTVKGFFGKPLSGLPGGGAGLGSAAGLASSGAIGAGAAGTTSGSSFGSSSFGTSGTSGTSGASGSSSFGSSSFGSSSSSTNPAANTVAGSSSTSSSTGISSQSATTFTGSGAPIMGVGTSATGDSITVLNEQKTYPTWEFIYDPRIEQLKAKASLLGGGPSSTNATSLGSGTTSSGFGGTTTPGATGTSPSGFGSSTPGSSTPGSSGSGGTTSPSAPATTPNP
jgi:type II secretory pathway pseudopilin PulG